MTYEYGKQGIGGYSHAYVKSGKVIYMNILKGALVKAYIPRGTSHLYYKFAT